MKKKKLHNDFFTDLDGFLRYAKNKRALAKILYEVFENDTGTSRELAGKEKNKPVNRELKKLPVHFRKALPHLLKMDAIMQKVRKISPKY